LFAGYLPPLLQLVFFVFLAKVNFVLKSPVDDQIPRGDKTICGRSVPKELSIWTPEELPERIKSLVSYLLL
jgi:hypothetical protein